MALPVVGSNVAIVAVDGLVTSIERTLSGNPNGTFGATGRRATIASSSGFIRTVSFQPNSFGSGGFTMPSQPTLFMSWTLNKWKWMAWVSTPL